MSAFSRSEKRKKRESGVHPPTACLFSALFALTPASRGEAKKKRVKSETAEREKRRSFLVIPLRTGGTDRPAGNKKGRETVGSAFRGRGTPGRPDLSFPFF